MEENLVEGIKLKRVKSMPLLLLGTWKGELVLLYAWMNNLFSSSYPLNSSFLKSFYTLLTDLIGCLTSLTLDMRLNYG